MYGESFTLERAYNAVHQLPMFSFVQMPDGLIKPLDGANPFRSDKIDLFPGSFNPIHDAHKAIFDQVSGTAYEISIERVNKSALSVLDLKVRLSQFLGYAPIVVLKHPLFIHKVGALYPLDITFHVGIDTASRIIECSHAVEIQGMRADFVVYDRIIDGRRHSLNDLPHPRPANFRKGQDLSEDLMKISSTAIRTGQSRSL